MKTKAELEQEMYDTYISDMEKKGCLIYAILMVAAIIVIGGIILMNWIVNLIFFPA